MTGLVQEIRNTVVIAIAAIVLLAGSVASIYADSNNGARKENSWRYKNGELIVDESSQTSNDSHLLTGSDKTVFRNGIDVSYAQGTIDWDKVKAAGIEYAILRIGFGAAYNPSTGEYRFEVDEQFIRNRSECERLGIPYGVYVYSYAESVEEAKWEARCAVSIMQGHNPEYPIYIDLEDEKHVLKSAGGDPTVISNMAKGFCEVVEDSGYMAGIYANLYWFNHYLTSSDLDKYEKWVAQYYSICEYEKDYYMWQYTSEGSISGIGSEYVDLNYDYVIREFTRYAGSDRYATAYSVAGALKNAKGIEQFDNIVVAVGSRYPDALSGAYYAKQKNAPILLYGENQESSLNDYINSNLKDGGTVYLLGDESSIPEQYAGSISEDYNVERIAGEDRYATNLELLKEYDSIESLLVCTGNNYPDSVSVSALDMPIMIVDKELTTEQEELLTELQLKGLKNIYVIGSNASVSDDIYNSLMIYAAQIERTGGSDRYQTSKLVAEKFFADKNPTDLIITRGDNFPDGLVGGTLAASLNSPILLANTWGYSAAKEYYKDNGIVNIYALGGNNSVSNAMLTRITN